MALDIRSPLYDAQSPFPCTPSTAAGDSPPGQYFTGAMVLDPKSLKRHRASNVAVSPDASQTGAPTSPETTSSTSIPSPCLTSSSGDGSPDLLRSSISSRPGARIATDIPAHLSSASIPIILAGLGVSGSPASTNSQESLAGTSYDGQKQQGSYGLGILQSSSKLSLPSSGKSQPSIRTSKSYRILSAVLHTDHLSSVSMSSEANLSITSTSSSGSSSTRTIEARALNREERADSWQSDMLTVAASSGSSSSSAVTSPEPSPRPKLPEDGEPTAEKYASGFPSRIDSLPQEDTSRGISKPPQKERTLSSNTQFTIETYTYSPFLDDLPEDKALQRWRMSSTDSRAALLPKSQGNRRSSSPLVGPPVPPKARNSLLTDPYLNRRRAVTISNPNAQAIGSGNDVRRRSSPPTTSASLMGGQGTFSSRQRSLFASQYSVTDIQVRPATSASQVTSSTLSRSGKPLPCLPGLGAAGSPGTPARRVGSDGYRSGSMSVSPAGRVWGMVSATSSDYRSLRSRDSLGSSFNESTTSPTAASFTSNSSSGGSGSQYYPPRPDSFLLMIDQESFREIRPIFMFSFYDSSTGIVEYMPKEPLASYPFHHGAIEAAPTLRRLVMPSYEDRDFLGKQATLPIKHEGIYVVAGVEGKGRWTWRFTYRISNRISLMGKAMLGEKCFVPISFCCEPQILDPAHSRKRKVFNIVYKTLVPKLEAVKIADLPPDLKPQLG